MRVPTSEDAIFALYTRGRRAHHRNSQGSVLESSRSVHFGPQRRRHEKSSDRYLCGWLDSAYLRDADYSRGCDAAASDGQYRAIGRWCECTARSFEYSRRDGYGRDLRQSAGLLESANPGRRRPVSLSETDHANFLKTSGLGLI